MAKQITINNHVIGKRKPVSILMEAGLNHNKEFHEAIIR